MFTFDQEKALEAIIYIASRTDGDMYRNLKIHYIADKSHLEQYGRFITGDSYHAIPYGPVPTCAFDAMKFVKGENESSPVSDTETAFSMDGNKILPLRNADTTVFSRSDLQCLDSTIERMKDMTFGELQNEVHDAAYYATNKNAKMSVETIASILPNAPELIQHLQDPHPGEAEQE